MRDLSLTISVEASQAKAELRETERHISATSKAAKDLDKSISESEKRLDKSFAEMEKSAKKLEDQVESLGKKKKETAASTDLLSNKIRNVLVGGAFVAAIKASADYADRLEEISVQTGLSIKALQQFDYAAKANGSSLEAVTRAAGTFQDRLAGGDKSVLRALERLSISYDVIRNKTPDQQMLELARAITAIKDPAERVNVAMDVFGRSGAALIPTLKALVENGGKTGVMTEESAKKFGQLSDALVKFKDVGLGTIANVLAPIAGGLMAVANAAEWAATKMSGFLATATGPIGMLNSMMGQFGDPSQMPDIKNSAQVEGRLAIWRDFLEKGRTNNLGYSGESPAVGLFGTDQLFGYTGEIERQLNDQLKEQARLHKARGDAAEEASRKAKKAAAEELAAWNDLLANNRALLADATSALGEDFNLFFGRGFTPRGGVYQGQGYWGQTDIPTIGSTDLGGVSGTMPGLQSAGNIAAWVNQRRRLTAQEQWNRQWMATYGDYSSWSDGALSAANAFGTYGQAVDDIARGDTKVLRDTNVRGRGNRAWRGALAGAQEGGQYGGPYGAAGGAVVGLLIGAFRNPAFEDIFNRIAYRFGEEVSEDLARNIEEIDKARKDWGREESEIYTVGAQMREIGVDDTNFDKMANRVRDIFVMVETGKFTVEEARKALDESFSQLAEHVQKSEHLASKSFQELIRLNKQFGLESEAVSQFVSQQSTTLGESIAAMAAPLVQNYGDYAEMLADAQTKVNMLTIAGKEHTEEYAKAVAEVNQVLAWQQEGAAKSAEELDRLGVIALASFNAAVEAGMSYLDAVDAMAPALDTLIGLQADLGITTENAALAELQAFREKVQQNEALIVSTEALGETMRALASIGGLNTETLAAMERQGLATFDKLRTAGFSEQQSLLMMKDYLINVIEAHEQLGIPIDENTGKLIDMADSYGLLRDDGKSMFEMLQGGFETLTNGINRLIETMGGIPIEVENIAGALNGLPTDIDLNVNVNYNDPGYDPYANNPSYAATGGYVTANGVQYLAYGGNVLGFRPRGTDTVPAMLTPGEGVLSRRGMQTLGELNRGGSVGGVSITFQPGAIQGTNAEDIADEVTDKIMRRLNQQKKYGRSAA